MARLKALSGLLLGGERERDRPRVGGKPSQGIWRSRLVAVELVRERGPGVGLEAFACLLLSGPHGLLGDLHSFWGGKEGAGGNEEGWGGSGWGWSRGPLGHLSKVPCPGERLGDVVGSEPSQALGRLG